MDQTHAPYFEALCAYLEGVPGSALDQAQALAAEAYGADGTHTKADLDRFVDALFHIAEHPSEHNLNSQSFVERALCEVPEQVLSPGEAFHAPQERVKLADAVGRISAEMAATYPPGIPVAVPGERLKPALVAHLAAQVAAGGRIVGPQDPKLDRIQVVCE